MVIGHRRRRSDRRRVLRRAHFVADHREYVVDHVDSTGGASDHVLVRPEASGAHQNPDHQKRHRQPGADYQSPTEDLER